MRDSTSADLALDGIPLPPFKLRRVSGSAFVSDDWHVSKMYVLDEDAPSNTEMKRIFEEDQRVRQSATEPNWSAVNVTDAIRRAGTMKLLSEGALHSGEDFSYAAFIFQHGSAPDDYLLAHTLAIIALRKGYTGATWIAAATLDRYLQSIKQPQIYGTQSVTPTGAATTQDPYDRMLIPDSLRRQLGVPDISAQQHDKSGSNSEKMSAKP